MESLVAPRQIKYNLKIGNKREILGIDSAVDGTNNVWTRVNVPGVGQNIGRYWHSVSSPNFIPSDQL